jgi:hypothetical protein
MSQATSTAELPSGGSGAALVLALALMMQPNACDQKRANSFAVVAFDHDAVDHDASDPDRQSRG